MYKELKKLFLNYWDFFLYEKKKVKIKKQNFVRCYFLFLVILEHQMVMLFLQLKNVIKIYNNKIIMYIKNNFC